MAARFPESAAIFFWQTRAFRTALFRQANPGDVNPGGAKPGDSNSDGAKPGGVPLLRTGAASRSRQQPGRLFVIALAAQDRKAAVDLLEQDCQRQLMRHGQPGK